MRIVTVGHPQVPGLGEVTLDLPTGLVAVVGGDGRVRRLAQQLIAGRLEGGRRVTAPVVADPLLTRLPADLQRILEDGGELDRPAAVVEVAARTLGLLDGLDRIEAARARLGRMRGADGRPIPRSGPEPEAILARIRELEAAPEELAALEAELRRLREDDAEVTGDLEVATMEWLRERQDAESRLQSYRDRARELKQRLAELDDQGASATCPTCQRPLEEHLSTVRSFLSDEWENVVQDGRWWRKRREQLELKPERLQELEGRSLRLHAATEALAEKVEVARTRMGELDEMRGRLAELAGVDRAPVPGPAGTGETADVPAEVWAEVDGALARAGRALRREARERLLDRIGRILGRITAGRILAVGWSDSGQLELGGVEGPLHPPAEEDAAAALVAARIAFSHAVATRIASKAPPLLLADTFDRMEEAVQVRTVELLRSMIGPVYDQVIVVTRGPIVDVCPEACDAILELRRDAVSGPSFFRRVPAGLGVLRIVGDRRVDQGAA